MAKLGTLTLIRGDAADFAMPRRAPRRRPRRSGRSRPIGRLVGVIRRELADAASPNPTGAVPRLRNYPY